MVGEPVQKRWTYSKPRFRCRLYLPLSPKVVARCSIRPSGTAAQACAPLQGDCESTGALRGSLVSKTVRRSAAGRCGRGNDESPWRESSVAGFARVPTCTSSCAPETSADSDDTQSSSSDAWATSCGRFWGLCCSRIGDLKPDVGVAVEPQQRLAAITASRWE